MTLKDVVSGALVMQRRRTTDWGYSAAICPSALLKQKVNRLALFFCYRVSEFPVECNAAYNWSSLSSQSIVNLKL
jgi:hypothetical protein